MKNYALHFLVIGAFTILFISILSPIHPSKEVWGDISHFDLPAQIDTIAWTAKQAAQGHLFSTFRNDLNYPYGGSFFMNDPIGSTFTIPFTWLFGPVFAYNLLVLAYLVFNCWAMFWLVYDRTKDKWAAMLAGTIFGLNPIFLVFYKMGAPEVLAGGWTVLFVGYVLKLLDFSSASEHGSEKQKRRLIALTAFFWWLATIGGNWYTGLIAGIIFVCILLANIKMLIKTRCWMDFAFVALIWLLLTLPIFLLFLGIRSSPDCLHQALTGREASQLLRTDFSPLEVFERSIYGRGFIAISILCFVIVGFIFGKSKRKRIAGWVLAAIVFLLFAIGPVWTHESLDGHVIRMPSYWLAYFFPSLSAMTTWRFLLGFHLCLSLAIGVGLARLVKNGKWQAVLMLGLGGIFVAEIYHAGGLHNNTNELFPSPVLRHLREQDDHAAVYPFGAGDKMGEYMFEQAFHEKPIVHSGWYRENKPSATLIGENIFLCLLDTPLISDFPSTPETSCNSRELLNKAEHLYHCLNSGQKCNKTILQELRKDLRRVIALRVIHYLYHPRVPGLYKKNQPIFSIFFGAPVLVPSSIKIPASIPRVYLFELKADAPIFRQIDEMSRLD